MAAEKVTKLYPNNAAENPDAVLEQAIGDYNETIVIGLTHEGLLDCRASLGLSEAEIVVLLERVKLRMIDLLEKTEAQETE